VREIEVVGEAASKISEDFNEWVPDSVHHRQRWMANQATAIWRIENL